MIVLNSKNIVTLQLPIAEGIIFTNFHRKNPRAALRCLQSDTVLANQLDNKVPFNVYKFKNGLIDVATPIVIDNVHFENISGYTKSQILEMHPLDFIVIEDKSRASKAIEEVFEKGKSSVEAGFTTNSGKIILFLLTGFKYIQDDIFYCIGVGVYISDRIKTENDKEQLINRLQKSISEIKVLSGLLPICASCKKIRDDKGVGYWEQIESSLSQHH